MLDATGKLYRTIRVSFAATQNRESIRLPDAIDRRQCEIRHCWDSKKPLAWEHQKRISLCSRSAVIRNRKAVVVAGTLIIIKSALNLVIG